MDRHLKCFKRQCHYRIRYELLFFGIEPASSDRRVSRTRRISQLELAQWIGEKLLAHTGWKDGRSYTTGCQRIAKATLHAADAFHGPAFNDLCDPNAFADVDANVLTSIRGCVTR
jgi:hypothetical protein